MATEMTNVFSANPGATGDDVELVVGDVSANDVALDVGEDAAEVAVDAAAATTAVGNAAASEEEGMDLDLGLRVLKSIPMLQHIHDNEMRKLIKALGRERFGAGVDVFKQGEVGRTFYIIREGEVGVLKSTDGGEPVFCATLGHGQSKIWGLNLRSLYSKSKIEFSCMPLKICPVVLSYTFILVNVGPLIVLYCLKAECVIHR